MMVSMPALPWLEGISSLPISGQRATPNRTPPAQSTQKSSHRSPLRVTFRYRIVAETAETTISDDPNQHRIVPLYAKPRRTDEGEIHKLFEWAQGTGFVTSFLYFFKPPFPSDGGYAAASAGRSGPNSPSVVIPL
jgi:hypothetical protein